MRNTKHYLFSLFVLCAMVAALFIAPYAAQARTVVRSIDNNDYYVFSSYGTTGTTIAYNDLGDDFTFSMTVENGQRADFYILNEYQYDNYTSGNPFTTAFDRQDYQSFPKTEWQCPTNEEYYLVVDNQDLEDRNDAYANETISVTIYWRNDTEAEEVSEFFASLCCFSSFCCMGSTVLVVAIPVVIIVIVIIIIIKISSDKKNAPPPPIMPPMQQPYQTPQQPAYQQPVQQQQYPQQPQQPVQQPAYQQPVQQQYQQQQQQQSAQQQQYQQQPPQQ